MAASPKVPRKGTEIIHSPPPIFVAYVVRKGDTEYTITVRIALRKRLLTQQANGLIGGSIDTVAYPEVRSEWKIVGSEEINGS